MTAEILIACLERAARVVAAENLPDRQAMSRVMREKLPRVQDWSTSKSMRGFLLEDGSHVSAENIRLDDGSVVSLDHAEVLAYLLEQNFGMSEHDIAALYGPQDLYERFGLVRVAGFNSIDVYTLPSSEQFDAIEKAFDRVHVMYCDINGGSVTSYDSFKRCRRDIVAHFRGNVVRELEAAAVVLAAGELSTRIMKTAESLKSVPVLLDLVHLASVGIGDDSTFQKLYNTFLDLRVENETDFDTVYHVFKKYYVTPFNVYRDWAKYIPWLGQQLAKNRDLDIGPLLPYVEESAEDQKAGRQTLWRLIREKGGDVNRLKLRDLTQEISTMAKQRVSQAEVAYKFADGWTLQKLTTKDQLAEEGAALNHCVGGYWQKVRDGQTEIYSLRDPAGIPNVTFEWLQKPKPRIMQVHGHDDINWDKFTENVLRHCREVVLKFFNGDPSGKELVGIFDRDFIDKKLKTLAGRRSLALNPALKELPDLAIKLADDQDEIIHHYLAQNPALKELPDLARKLADDPYSAVRAGIAINCILKDLPDLASKLASDQDAWVRRYLASNPELKYFPDLAIRLAGDQDVGVRQRLAQQPALKDLPDVVTKLASDQIAVVRQHLAKNPALKSVL